MIDTIQNLREQAEKIKEIVRLQDKLNRIKSRVAKDNFIRKVIKERGVYL